MSYTKKRWLILTASCFINLCIGSLYAWSVLAGPMAEYLGGLKGVTLTAKDLAIVFTLANSVGPITMIAGGKINDTLGPKIVVLLGGMMFGGGMFLSGFANSVGFLIVTYSLLLGLGLGMVYGATISTCIKFFPDKRGLVGGLTTSTFGISSVIIPPIAAAIISATGPTTAFKVIGGAFIVIIGVSSLFIEKCPADFVPEGFTPPAAVSGGKKTEDKDWKAMLATPEFYVMITMLTCGAFAALMFIPMISPIAQNMIGISPAAATAAVSTLALFNVFGRVFAGSISDRIGRINTLAAACVFSVLGLVLLFMAKEGDIALFYVGISIIGICFGAFMGVFPGFTADQFGPRYNSVNYGIMFIGFALAGYVGPSILNHIYGGSGSYNKAFFIAMIFSAAGLVLTFLYRMLKKRQ
ncbi:OFA family MFS transporter [Anaerocolumna sp. AGMB13020]|uniref:L-lactate MFS transporter n=1 Tax=Anaerocolumna sp. AGMB13020 TaxID=3081750 RepID=UPI002953865A|nr:OFA family MFS transporter [Anaerocolumna sp. AGMB13020]WOO38337.1 OFA family MFS transporter [Anaerocolumna sp. AGMB13020]